MTQAELFDIIELLVDLPEYSLYRGVQGAIPQGSGFRQRVECYPDETYEVEFTNQDGETVALCVFV